MSNIEKEKKEVAHSAISFVKNQDRLGLGTGSTTNLAIQILAERIEKEKIEVTCVASSLASYFFAYNLGIHCLPLEETKELDLSIDGADEIDEEGFILKGGGGAHTREKIMHAMSKRFIVIGDSSKRVKQLGAKFPIPVEILPPAKAYVWNKLEHLGAEKISLRTAKGKCGPILTDNGNWILDVYLKQEKRKDFSALEEAINGIIGVIENGIFAKLLPNKEDYFLGKN